ISNYMSKAALEGQPRTTVFLNEFHSYFGMLITCDTANTVMDDFEDLQDPPTVYDVPHNDPHFDAEGFNNGTMVILRSPKYEGTNLPGVPRLPINQATAWLDANWLYPPDPVVLNMIR